MRMIVIVPDTDKPDALILSADIFGHAKYFHAPLSADGSLPASHWVASGIPSTLEWMLLLQGLAQFPDAVYWRVSEGSEIAATNSGMGQWLPFDYQAALAHVGLQPALAEPPP